MGAPQTSENTHTNEFGNKSEMRNTKKTDICTRRRIRYRL